MAVKVDPLVRKGRNMSLVNGIDNDESPMVGTALEIAPPSPEYLERLAVINEDRQRIEWAGLRDGPRHVVTGGHRTGKTLIAMKWLLDGPEDTNRVLIVPSAAIAEHLRREYGLRRNDPRIITYKNFQRFGPRADVQYGIDETVEILQRLLGMKQPPRLLTIGTAESWQP